MTTDLHDLTAAYALDALDAGEREAYERHLDECPRCREELASLGDVTGALAIAAGGPPPPVALRDRILTAAREEPPNVVALDGRRSRAPRTLAAVAAIAAVVAIALGAYAVSLHGRLGDARSALEAQRDAAAVLADPAASTVAMQSGSGRLVVGADGAAVLVLDRMPPAPSGKTYEAWVVKGTTPVPAGTFAPRGGRAVVPVGEPVPTGAVVAVTIEDAGGASTPTLPLVAASKPV